MSKLDTSLGVLMTSQVGTDGFASFQSEHTGLVCRDEARDWARKILRFRLHLCVLFIRLDGLHESWGRGELEEEQRPARVIPSKATHEVTGRGTIKIVALADGPFREGQRVQIDGQLWRIEGIEMSGTKAEDCGLVVTPVSEVRA